MEDNDHFAYCEVIPADKFGETYESTEVNARLGLNNEDQFGLDSHFLDKAEDQSNKFSDRSLLGTS